jgi:putative transposase
MKTGGYTEAQIIEILRWAEGVMPVTELCREHWMSSASFYKRRAKYGGMDASLISQMKAMDDENRRLKRMYADLSMQADHLRTSNPIESVFATVRHRTVRTKGALSQKTVKLMVFTLVRAASKTWRRLNGAIQLPRVIEGVKFTDGVANTDPAKTSAA